MRERDASVPGERRSSLLLVDANLNVPTAGFTPHQFFNRRPRRRLRHAHHFDTTMSQTTGHTK